MSSTLFGISTSVTTHLCKTCGETDPENMMNKGGGRKCLSLCKSCHNANTIRRGRKNRQQYLDYLGGKCANCGYHRCPDALEFHHLDPSQKDLTFRSIRYWGLERAKEELDKCILLCSNCHREAHYTWSDLVEPTGVEPVLSALQGQRFPN